MLREIGVNLPGFFSFFILRSHTSQAQESLVTSEAATDIALGLHRNPKLSNKRTSSLIRWVTNPRKWEQIVLAFLFSVFLLLGPKSNGSQRKYTAEQVIKTTTFWPEDHKEEAQATRIYQRDDAHEREISRKAQDKPTIKLHVPGCVLKQQTKDLENCSKR